MGSVTIRNLDDEIKQAAKLAAVKNGRSLEAELRALLERTYTDAGARHAARLRKMSGESRIEHLITVANGAGEGVFDNLEDLQFSDFDL